MEQGHNILWLKTSPAEVGVVTQNNPDVRNRHINYSICWESRFSFICDTSSADYDYIKGEGWLAL
jgi:hypothetical protein